MTIIRPKSGGIDLTTAVEPIAEPADAVLRRIVEGVAYHHEDPAIRAVSAPWLDSDGLAAAARELLRRADEATRAARAASGSWAARPPETSLHGPPRADALDD